MRATALDGAAQGFRVRVLDSLVAAVSPDNLPRVRQELEAADVLITSP